VRKATTPDTKNTAKKASLTQQKTTNQARERLIAESTALQRIE